MCFCFGRARSGDTVDVKKEEHQDGRVSHHGTSFFSDLLFWFGMQSERVRLGMYTLDFSKDRLGSRFTQDNTKVVVATKISYW